MYGLNGADPYAFMGASQAPSQATLGAGGGYSSQLPRFEGLTPSPDAGARPFGGGGASQGFHG